MARLGEEDAPALSRGSLSVTTSSSVGPANAGKLDQRE